VEKHSGASRGGGFPESRRVVPLAFKPWLTQLSSISPTICINGSVPHALRVIEHHVPLEVLRNLPCAAKSPFSILSPLISMICEYAAEPRATSRNARDRAQALGETSPQPAPRDLARGSD
jgi:hypothetical protein